jgi:alpha-glucosidase
MKNVVRLVAPKVVQAGLVLLLCGVPAAWGATEPTEIKSPNGRNVIVLEADAERNWVKYSVNRDGAQLFKPSKILPVLAETDSLAAGARVVDVQRGMLDSTFAIPWGKTTTVVDRCSRAVVTLATASNLRWQVELRAYDDGVAFRYVVPAQPQIQEFELRDEATEFLPAGQPHALFNTLDSSTTSHESLYEHKPIDDIPVARLIDMPMLLTWPNGHAAAITEGRVRDFAGMYLERPSADKRVLRARLSPLLSDKEVSVKSEAPLESPWRVILLADTAGRLLESNLLLCLNDPPTGDFSWARPGKTSFHWWYGEFEDDYKPPIEPGKYLERHKAYIDFCAANNIAYHAVSGDGRSWYVQSSTDYGVPSPDADVRKARPELELPKIIAYAKERGVGIRLWVHWKPLSEHLDEAFALYESWGVKGLMVDFLDRDDQQMVEFTERMLESAARHHLHIQIHGSSKYSGEQRTFPNLFNREGVLNLEYLKWSDLCTPAHSVNVAYTRALAGPVDFHLGGFRSVSRAKFQPRDRAPLVMGTRCHNLALYVVYENPMPMVADAPHSYEGQAGFDFIREVPTTWDETRFLTGEPGEYIVLARRKGESWYLAGITNWTSREVDVPLDALGDGSFTGQLYADGSKDEEQPNALKEELLSIDSRRALHVSMASGGGFVAVLRSK